MAHWVLIVTLIAGNGEIKFTTMQEFDSEQTCHIAEAYFSARNQSAKLANPSQASVYETTCTMK